MKNYKIKNYHRCLSKKTNYLLTCRKPNVLKRSSKIIIFELFVLFS